MEDKQDVTKTPDQAGWNTSMYDIVLISKLKEKAVGRNLRGNYLEAFRIWINIKQIIYSRFSSDEFKKLREIENKLANNMKHIDKSKNYYMEKDKVLAYNNRIAHMILDDYIYVLSKLMKKYNLGIADKEQKRRL